MSENIELDVCLYGAASMQLDDWKLFVEKLIEEHGESAVMKADAGPYNVQLVIIK